VTSRLGERSTVMLHVGPMRVNLDLSHVRKPKTCTATCETTHYFRRCGEGWRWEKVDGLPPVLVTPMFPFPHGLEGKSLKNKRSHTRHTCCVGQSLLKQIIFEHMCLMCDRSLAALHNVTAQATFVSDNILQRIAPGYLRSCIYGPCRQPGLRASNFPCSP
ncbi:unnamed protein product, partial [Ectocarpus sp. 4 AP-2014]